VQNGEVFTLHDGIDGVKTHALGLFLKARDVLGLGLHGHMHGVVPKVEEEGAIVLFADELDGFVGQAVG